MPPSSRCHDLSEYNLDLVYRDIQRALQEIAGGSGGAKASSGVVVDKGNAEGTCKECHSPDNSLVLDVKNNQLVCRLCGFVDSEPVQCEWDNSSHQLLLGGNYMRRKTVPYNHCYYFSEKLRCANGEGMMLVPVS